MKVNEAISHMLETSKRSAYNVSLAMGKAHSYVNSLSKRKGFVSAHVLSSIADVCGYDLLLVNRQTGETIPIDPTGQDESKTD